MSLSSAPIDRLRVALLSTAIFMSAFLLFALEPIVAKRILPWFGGSAAVWSTCLVFYQSALLLGYGYSSLLTRKQLVGRSGWVHIAVVAVSLLFLPIGPGVTWSHPDVGRPVWAILSMLLATIGLPFAVLSSTSPLLQAWAARAGDRVPYRLFALSNLASLCALLSYPFLVEPAFSIRTQAAVWSSLYVVFALLVLGAALLSGRVHVAQAPEAEANVSRRYVLAIDRVAWFTLSACASTLLLAITNYLSANVAAVPLLWVLPLAVYLLTFITAFSGKRAFRRALWLRLLAAALGVLGYAIYDVNAFEAVQISIPIFLAGLYVCCYFCHSELYARRPDAGALTGFYLAVAAGGAAGAILVGLVAPVVFSGIYELPFALAFIAGLATLLTWQASHWALRSLWVGVSACMVAVIVSNVLAYRENTLVLRRSFYGSLRVKQSPHVGPEQLRSLYHGTIRHGAQYVQLPRRLRPYTYYGPESGVGIMLREFPVSPKRVAVVGLGTGTVAAFGRPGDRYRFFEINSQVTDIAQSVFTYLRESKAHVDVVEGDGRLALANDPGPPFNVIVLDAFSGDAIPVHLLTGEAMRIYRHHLAPNGVIVIHVSNNFLDLAPVVQRLADAEGLKAVLVRNHSDDEEGYSASDWMLVTQNDAVLRNEGVIANSEPVTNYPGLPVWTDDYNNLVQILKTPHWR